MQNLIRHFFQGLLFLAPIAVTLYVFIASIIVIDSWLQIPIPGVGLIVLIAFITLSGFVASTILRGAGERWIDGLFGRLPLAKLIYSAVKDLLGAFVGDQKRFDAPVLVDLVPDGAVRALGFATRESLAMLDLTDTIAVYYPQSYGFAGNLLLVRKERVHRVDLDSAELMAFIVSAGVASSALTARPTPAPRSS